MLEVGTLVRREELDDIAAAWDGLHADCGGGPFSSRIWFDCWWRSFGEGADVRIVTVWGAQRLVGVLPLQVRRRRIVGPLFLRSLHALSNDHSPEFSPLIDRHHRREALEALGRVVREDASVDRIGFERLALDEPALNDYQDTFSTSEFLLERAAWPGSYYVDFANDFETFYQSLGRSFRKDRNNKNNRLAKAGAVDFDVEEGYVPGTLDEFYEIEKTGWKSEQGTAIAQEERVRDFYDRLAMQSAGRGEFRLVRLRLDGRLIAGTYGLCLHRVFYFLKVAIDYSDDALMRHSPGQAMLYRLMQYCFDRQLEGFDFCGPFYDYEAKWTKGVRQKYVLDIYHRASARTKLFLALRAAKRALWKPEPSDLE